MGFSERYLQLCFSKQRMARNKECQKGDWYVDIESSDLRVAAQFGEVDYSKGDAIYIPDLDDLLELLSNSLQVICGSADDHVLEITSHPENGWSINLHHRKGLTVVPKADSLHTALFIALLQLSICR